MTKASDSYIQRIVVKIPSTSKWQAELAEQLMVSLFSFSSPIHLSIVAYQGVYWCLEASKDQVEAITRTFYAAYPRAVITS